MLRAFHDLFVGLRGDWGRAPFSHLEVLVQEPGNKTPNQNGGSCRYGGPVSDFDSEWDESIDFESIGEVDDQAGEPAAKRPRTGVESHGRRQHDVQGDLTLFVFFF